MDIDRLREELPQDLVHVRPFGRFESCDWVRVENDRIQESRSFYDSAETREVLSTAEQDSLDGWYATEHLEGRA